MQKEQCCGCKMCADACPKQCITYKEDSEGFFYPVVDGSTCVDCGKCVSLCPELNPVKNPEQKLVYACYSKDEETHYKGSSGGVFAQIARHVLNQNGKVWGAAFDDNLQLKHIPVTCEDDLIPLFKSKYLQSNCASIYKQIKDDLKQGILTLFCGTPCQCNALKNYVGHKLLENLVLIDFVCHGVPSQQLFNQMINWLEEKENGKITNFTFRQKGEKHLQAYSYVLYKNGKTKIKKGLHYQNPFYFGFQKHITLRPSCYNCKWSNITRCSDITLGDFWGIEKYSFMPKDKGVSMILTNTSRGCELFSSVSDSLEYEKYPVHYATENNGCLVNSTKEPKERSQFFKDLENQNFDYMVNRYLKSKRQYVFDFYYAIPTPIRKIVRKIMDKKVKYE